MEYDVTPLRNAGRNAGLIREQMLQICAEQKASSIFIKQPMHIDNTTNYLIVLKDISSIAMRERVREAINKELGDKVTYLRDDKHFLIYQV